MQKADLGSTGIIQVKVAIRVLQGDTPEGDLHSEGAGVQSGTWPPCVSSSEPQAETVACTLYCHTRWSTGPGAVLGTQGRLEGP